MGGELPFAARRSKDRDAQRTDVTASLQQLSRALVSKPSSGLCQITAIIYRVRLGRQQQRGPASPPSGQMRRFEGHTITAVTIPESTLLQPDEHRGVSYRRRELKT